MEQTFTAIMEQGLTLPLAFELIKLLVIVFVVMAIREWMTGKIVRKLAYRRVQSNRYLKAGCWIKWPTSTEPITCVVNRIEPNKVVLQTEDRKDWLHIDILQFDATVLRLPVTVPDK